MRPFQLPYLYQRVFFFFRTHPLEVRWSWNCGAVVIPAVFSDPWTPSLRISPILRPATSVVPIDDTREENTADKEIGPAGPYTIPSPCSTVHGQREFPSRRHSWRLTAASNWSKGRNKSSTIEPYPSGSQFADNVNLHPTPLGHGDPHTDPNRQRGRGKIPRSQRPASQVINHRTISRRLQPPSAARSAMTFLSRGKFLRKKKV